MKMIHDIRYVGLAGEINFSKEPYMYQDTDLFNYNIEYDLNYFPSGRGGKVKRFKQWPQVNTLTLGVINRTDVRELVSKLERHFQVDINAKTPAKLFINGSYTECYIVSSVKTYFNRFLGINFITLEILRENPVWTTEEEYSYQRADLQTNPYDLNLIKPPYDFSELEFTQPAKSLKEANLIPNGWDDFEPYPNNEPLGHYFPNYQEYESNGWYVGFVTDFKAEPNKEYVFQWDYEHLGGVVPHIDVGTATSKNQYHSDLISHTIKADKDFRRVFKLRDVDVENGRFYISFRLRMNQSFSKFRFGNIKIYEKERESPKVVKTPLGNGLTRIRTWGGSNVLKLIHPFFKPSDITKTWSLYIKNTSNNTMRLRINQGLVVVDIAPADSSFVKLTLDTNDQSRYEQYQVRTTHSEHNLDFIASDPIIYEDDGSMIYDIEEYDDKYRVRTMNSHSKTKMKFPIKKSVFKNEQYTHSLYVENKGNKDVLFKSEEGLYLENPVVEIKPDEQGTYLYTGTASQDSLYTDFELATKEEEDELDLVLAKPAVRYGDKPFDWPPEEEIVPLRLPTHMPFWITADDSIKYISNNSIGDTLAKITVFGPIKNPTLYIGSNTYRVYEELLENERIEIDQRAKTVIKVTASGDRVNVFHLRDKEHSVFKPIPEGENTVTQNDDFSYTIVLYHERNEPKWT